jgi:hypothetical protein
MIIDMKGNRHVTAAPKRRVPSNDLLSGPREIVDPKTGKRVPTTDVRKKFARISAEAGRNPEAERAFINSKIEMIRRHPTLSEPERSAAISELEEKLKRLLYI